MSCRCCSSKGRSPTHIEDGSHCVRVVGGELRIHAWGQTQERRGAGEVGQVCVRLVSADGVPWQTLLLGRLDLRIQVGALAQTHMDPAPTAPGQLAQQGRRPVGHTTGRPEPQFQVPPSRSVRAPRIGLRSCPRSHPAARPPRRRWSGQCRRPWPPGPTRSTAAAGCPATAPPEQPQCVGRGRRA